MFDITCSIVIYRNPIEEVRKAINSFLNCQFNVKLYLIDNSGEDSRRYEYVSPRIEYIFTGRNIGFGAAHNLAIKKCIKYSRYHLILNPDIEFDPGVIERIFHFMNTRIEIGLVMPKVLYRSGEVQFLCRMLPAPSDMFMRRFVPGPVKYFFRSAMDRYLLKHKDYDSIMEIPNLCGCFMFIRTDVFKSVGLFDEQYFLYFEDTDLCRRIHEKFKTVYFPRVSVIHGYARASYKNTKLLFRHVQSGIRYFNKWGWFNDATRLAVNNIVCNPEMFKKEFKTLERISARRPLVNFSVKSRLQPTN